MVRESVGVGGGRAHEAELSEILLALGLVDFVGVSGKRLARVLCRTRNAPLWPNRAVRPRAQAQSFPPAVCAIRVLRVKDDPSSHLDALVAGEEEWKRC